MNISKKIILFFILLFFILLLFIAISIKNAVESTVNHEEKNLIKSIKKLEDVLTRHGRYLRNISYEYSTNEQIKKLIHAKDTHKLATNILNKPDLMEKLNLSYLIFFDKEKKLLEGNSYDLSSSESLSIPMELVDYINNHNIGKFIDSEDIFYMTLSYEKVIFAIEAIKEANQVVGYVFLARTLDSGFLTDISENIQEYITLISAYKKRNTMEIASSKNQRHYDVEKINDDYILSYVNLYDQLMEDDFYIQVKHKREMYKELISEIKFSAYTFVVLISLIGIVFFIFIRRVLTQRIEYITNKVKEASLYNNHEVKLNVSYNDELSYLSTKINEMFGFIRAHQNQSLQKERDFLQSVLDTQQNIIMITDGKNIQSTNKKFNEIFDSQESFLNSIALMDNKTKLNLISFAKRYNNQDKAAKFQIVDDQKYFTFEVSKLDIKKYLICMNDVSNLNKKINHLEIKASIDELTSVYNKSTITTIASNWLNLKPFCFVIFDIDHFKHINDTYGHYIGDCILKDLAKLISNEIPKEDMFGRFGGEEFLLLIDINSPENILKIANRIRVIIQDHTFVYDTASIKLTVSMGCTFCECNETFKSVYTRADAALYEAKRAGRNQTIVA